MAATFDYDALSDEEKLSYDMFKFRAATAARSGRFMEQQYVLHQFNGSQSTLPAFLLSQHKVETESDMVAFIARFGALCPVIDQLLGTSAGQCRCRHKAAALFLRRCNRRIDETGPGCPVRQWTGVSALGRK